MELSLSPIADKVFGLTKCSVKRIPVRELGKNFSLGIVHTGDNFEAFLESWLRELDWLFFDVE
jgi:hypothetical protein